MLRSLWGWTVVGSAMLLALPWMALFAIVLPRPVTWRIGQAVYRTTFFLMGVRVVLKGLERVEPDTPYVLVGNHVNLFDPFILCCAFPNPATGMEKRANFKIPIYGFMMKRWGILPISPVGDLEQAKRDMDAAGEVLARERSWVVVFPEGRRTRDGKLQPFKKGAAHLAIGAGVDVVPFVMNGAVEVFRTGSWRLRGGLIEVELFAPISVDEKTDPKLLTERAQAAVVAAYREP